MDNFYITILKIYKKKNIKRDRRGRDLMVVGFTTTYAISAITTDVVSWNLDKGEVYNIM